jgi:hypothetical protein
MHPRSDLLDLLHEHAITTVWEERPSVFAVG